MHMGTHRISVVVPTLNEAENIPVLVPRVAEALRGRDWEMLIVDDNSKDATPQVCADLAKTYPVRLLVREKPVHGLSGAVLHGFGQATGDVLVVMDADLQHPPEKVPDLVETVTTKGADFALGSRYAGGSMEGSWGAFRRLNSSVATALARPFSGGVKDPMSGFFALKRETFARAKRLSPLGYKIALELMCKCQVREVTEVPIHFGLRQHGQSKLSMRQQFHYLQHLSRLYDFQYPRAAPMVKFLIVLMVGILLAACLFAGLLSLGVGMAWAVLLAYALHIGITALFHARYITTQREFLVSRRPWADFILISIGELAAVAAAANWLLWRLNTPRPAEVFVLAFLAGTVMRYVLRKELLQDVRGLRHEIRVDEVK
jgi:dolichol-phosphate mannosyltransferase